MIDAMLIWFIELFPVFDFGFLDALAPWASLISWTGMFVDYSFLGTVLGWLLGAELAINVGSMVARMWEHVPGM